jgi:mono/diheme cytochrome c family protein
VDLAATGFDMKRISLLFFIAFLLTACGQQTETTTSDNSSEEKDPLISGKNVYEENCAICHGGDGKLGSGGAKDLSVSNISQKESIQIIRDGKGGMTPFRSLLTSEEIDNVALYIEQLRNK